MRIRKKYDQLTREVTKVMPRVFREENHSLTKELFGKLRCFMPKGFFNAVKSIMKDNKKGQQALGFEASVVNGVIEEPPTIAEYIEKLYKCEEVHYQPTMEFPD
jgi:hypothetical protein